MWYFIWNTYHVIVINKGLTNRPCEEECCAYQKNRNPHCIIAFSVSGISLVLPERGCMEKRIESQPLDTIFHSGKAQQRGQAIGNCTDKERRQQIPQFLSKP